YWTDESIDSYVVSARGHHIARCMSSAMVNGTKLLNCAGLSRGRRDYLLRKEPLRRVLKKTCKTSRGVWIPYQRAVDLAHTYNVYHSTLPLLVEDPERY
ncbi:transcription regulator HTH, apses-type DNA-binding domain-containing protein, partial [Dimargaris cristalligena]